MAEKELVVGAAPSVARVTVFDQNDQPITDFDFAANPPSWTIDQPAAVKLDPGAEPNTESLEGVSETTTPATLSVSIPGVTNPDDHAQITVVGPPPPPRIPTRVAISFD